MAARRVNAIARHVEAARRLLDELEQQADAACHALGRESGAEFFTAVDERSRILGDLDVVVMSIAEERAAAIKSGASEDAATNQLLSEMAQAAARALESQNRLAAQTRRERDRLGLAVHRADRPDSVATQYSVASSPARRRALSVTG